MRFQDIAGVRGASWITTRQIWRASIASLPYSSRTAWAHRPDPTGHIYTLHSTQRAVRAYTGRHALDRVNSATARCICQISQTLQGISTTLIRGIKTSSGNSMNDTAISNIPNKCPSADGLGPHSHPARPASDQDRCPCEREKRDYRDQISPAFQTRYEGDGDQKVERHAEERAQLERRHGQMFQHCTLTTGWVRHRTHRRTTLFWAHSGPERADGRV